MTIEEYELLDKKQVIAGIDEAGRGPLAGPVIIAGVIFKDKFDDDIMDQIKDSKKLSEKKREELFDYIGKHSKHSIKICNNNEIDAIGIGECINKSVIEIYQELAADITIFDGGWDPVRKQDFKTMISGDIYVKEISAASILAKVVHDRIIYKIHELIPEYHLNENKGYGTKQHIDLIKEFGRSKYHRNSFKIKGYDKVLSEVEKNAEMFKARMKLRGKK